MSESEERISAIVHRVVQSLGDMNNPSSNSNGRANLFQDAEEEINARFQIPRVSVFNFGDAGSASGSARGPRNTGGGVPYNPRRSYPSTSATNSSGSRFASRNSMGRYVPYNLTRKGKKQPEKAEMYHKDVCLLPSPTWDTVPRRKAKSALIKSGFYIDAFRLDKLWDENAIRRRLVDVFDRRLVDDAGEQTSFEFVKSAGDSIVPLHMEKGQDLNGAILKHIAGQGPIYIRALKEIRQVDSDDGQDDGEEHDNDICAYFDGPLPDSSNCENHDDTTHADDTPNANVRENNRENKRTILLQMFPQAEPGLIGETIDSGCSLEDAIENILEQSRLADRIVTEGINERNDQSLEEIIHQLAEKMTGQRIKLAVDPDDIIHDALSFYKSPDFKPECPIRVHFSGQPAIDSGGVRRQFYSNLFTAVIESEHFKLFEGPLDNLKFSYNQQALNTGIVKILGRIVAHSIIQGGPGFPCLSLAHYCYISTEDLSKATAYASIHDVTDMGVLECINKIQNARNNQDFTEINQDEDCINSLSNAGLTMSVTLVNKDIIIQSLISHDVIAKRVAVLNQFSSGLDMLGLLSSIKQWPDKFERMFVYSRGEVTSESVKEILVPPSSMDEQTQTVWQLLLEYLEKGKATDLKLFLKFTTASEYLLSVGHKKVTVDISDTYASIFASTCLLELHLPASMGNLQSEDFRSTLDAVLYGNSFNTY